jgi:arylsulfatase A-like enzyme
MNRPALSLAALASLLLAAPSAAPAGPAGEPGVAPPSAPKRPSAIVLVTVDTLRADAVSFAGYGLPTTPFLDRLAKEGVVFTNAYAPSSWTPPSMASIFTGLEPSSHGVTRGSLVAGEATEHVVLSDSLVTLAERLKARGRTTVGVASNRHLSRVLGFAQGFDHFHDPTAFLPAPTLDLRAKEQLAAAFGADWRTGWRRGAMFLWLHYFDPHDPYLPNDPWLDRHSPGRADRTLGPPARLVMRQLKRRFPRPGPELAALLRPLYDGEVARVDDHLRQLWEELGADDDVLLVVTSDHGEELAERGGLGHSHSLHEELVRVPLLVRWPRGLPGGRRIDAPVAVTDLAAAIAALDGEILAGTDRERALPRWLGDPANAAPRPVFLELHPPKPALVAVRDGSWKLIAGATGTRAELYDLAADPGERRDLAAERPEVVARLRAALERWRAALPAPPPLRLYTSPDAQLTRELRSLGYVDE